MFKQPEDIIIEQALKLKRLYDPERQLPTNEELAAVINPLVEAARDLDDDELNHNWPKNRN